MLLTDTGVQSAEREGSKVFGKRNTKRRRKHKKVKEEEEELGVQEE